MRPAHRGELRVLVAVRRSRLGQVRAYLAADLLRRVAERASVLASVCDLPPESEDGLRTWCSDLNIHPPFRTLALPVSAGELGGLFVDGFREPVFDVGIRLAGEEADPAWQRLAATWIGVAGAVAAADLGAEPLAVRLALMRHGYAEVLNGGDPAGGAAYSAAQTLARWRKRVAEWARSPSGPMSRRYADAIVAALEGNLDTAAALRELAALEADPGEPDGVKFETFAAADRLLGLDLVRDIGR